MVKVNKEIFIFIGKGLVQAYASQVRFEAGSQDYILYSSGSVNIQLKVKERRITGGGRDSFLRILSARAK